VGWSWGFAYLAGWSFEKYRVLGICSDCEKADICNIINAQNKAT